MNPLRHRPRAIPALASLASIVLGVASGASTSLAWDAAGVPVASTDSIQVSAVVAADGQGGAVFAWQDDRYGYGCSLSERLTPDGAQMAGWPADGFRLAGANSGYDPAIAGDGSGGAIVAWRYFGTIIVQHVAAAGVLYPGWPFAGNAVDGNASQPLVSPARPAAIEKSSNDIHVILLADGAGGAFIAWERDNITANIICAEHVAGSGQGQWGMVFVDPSFLNKWSHSMCSDDSGGVIVANIVEGSTVHAKRITAAGVGAPGWPADGALVCGASGSHDATGIVSDGAGGAIVVWEDGRNGAYEQVYAQHLNRDGTIAPGWPADGLVVSASPTAPGQERLDSVPRRFSSVIADGSGGAIIAWSDARNAGNGWDIYCQHLLGDGTIAPGFAPNGAPICKAPGDQVLPTLAPDGAGGAFITWQDHRSPTAWNVFVQHVDGIGSPAAGWSADGLALAAEPFDQLAPSIAATGPAEATIAWEDHRSGFAQIRAGHVASTGVTSVILPRPGDRLSLAAPFPNPAARTFTARISLPDDRSARLELIDVAGRRVQSVELQGAGAHTIRFAVAGEVRPGMYRLALRQGDRFASVKLCLMR